MKHVKQLQQRLVRTCAAAKPSYLAQVMRPSHTAGAMAAADRRIDTSLELISEADKSPCDRRSRALMQQRLPLRLGGSGVDSAAATAAPRWVASVARSWADLRVWIPRLADIDIATSTLPFFREFRSCYDDLRRRRADVETFHLALTSAAGAYFDFDGETRVPFLPKGLPPASALPSDVSAFANRRPKTSEVCDPSMHKLPAQRSLCSVVHHEAWVRLQQLCAQSDSMAAAAGSATMIARECSRLTSTGAEYAGAWLDVLPTSWLQKSSKFAVGLQRRLGLYISAAAAHFDAVAAEGDTVTESDRLGDSFAHAANHSTAHKWMVVAWRNAEAATTLGTVYMGDKKKGKEHYSVYCATYVPDVIKLDGGDDGRPELDEIKNYSPFVHPATSHPACTSLVGGLYAFGNTEERLKHKVLGSRRRGVPSAGRFNHKDGSGFVPAAEGDYRDALANRKARVHLLVHETLGGFSPYAARRLRRLGRLAAENGVDATDYKRSYTAHSFVPYHSQSICSACVMHGSDGILKGIRKASHSRLRAVISRA